MTTYVTLAEFTHEAIQNVSDSARLFEFLEDRAEETGGDLTDAYVTLGEYDVVILSEFPDDESYARFALTIANQGGLTTDTLRGFTEAEYAPVTDEMTEIEQPQIWGDS